MNTGNSHFLKSPFFKTVKFTPQTYFHFYSCIPLWLWCERHILGISENIFGSHKDRGATLVGELEPGMSDTLHGTRQPCTRENCPLPKWLSHAPQTFCMGSQYLTMWHRLIYTELPKNIIAALLITCYHFGIITAVKCHSDDLNLQYNIPKSVCICS